MFRELLAREFAPYARLTDRQLELLEAHYVLLKKWNARLNLTRIESIEEAVRFHYCECLFLATRLPPGPLRIVDIGSGSGFPGIPIAILRPECEVSLVESNKRKAVFLSESSRSLPNVQVSAARAEAVQSNFDWAVTRAVTPGAVLALSLARNFAFLLGAEEAHKFELKESLPWGRNRYLVFHVKHTW